MISPPWRRGTAPAALRKPAALGCVRRKIQSALSRTLAPRDPLAERKTASNLAATPQVASTLLRTIRKFTGHALFMISRKWPCLRSMLTFAATASFGFAQAVTDVAAPATPAPAPASAAVPAIRQIIITDGIEAAQQQNALPDRG